MTFTFLGTGTSQGVPVIGCRCAVCQSLDPRDKRLRTSGMIGFGGKNIVIDAGPDFRQQLLRAKVDDIEGILFTHEHTDHIIGLDDVRPFNFRKDGKAKDMPLYATDRVQGDMRTRFSYGFQENPYPGSPRFDMRTISKDAAFELVGLRIVPIEVMHGQLPILGFRVGAFTYLTDCKSIAAEEWEKMVGTKTLVVNALHHHAHHAHLNLTEALALIERLKPERAYLIHLSHKMGLYEKVSKSLPENVFLAYDEMVINI